MAVIPTRIGLETHDESLAAALAEQIESMPDFELVRAGQGCAVAIADSRGCKRAIVVCAGDSSEELKKPFRFRDLLQRVRRAAGAGGSCAPSPPGFDAIARSYVLEDGSVRRLTEKEAAILSLLSQAGEAGVTRDDLLNAVWDYRSDVDTHTLETHIYRLRRKVEKNPLAPERILTTASGYRLSSSISRMDE